MVDSTPFLKLSMLVAILLLTSIPISRGQNARASKKGRQRQDSRATPRLSAQKVAQNYLPSVVLIVGEDENGNIVQGSGFFITRELIITNYHVIDGMINGVVKFALRPGRPRTLAINAILNLDRTADLALISINEKPKFDIDTTSGVSPEVAEMLDVTKHSREQDKRATRKSSSPDDPLGINEFLENRAIPCLAPYEDPVTVGESIYVLGNPEGLTGTISQGIVSGLRHVRDINYIQITAPVSHGSSGGPVINTRGQVIGVVVASFTSGQNLNFAISSDRVREIATQIGPCPI